jgi:DNA-binding transcriptional LysR family regulator
MKQTPDRLTLMQTFIRIVEAGSLSAAAAQLNTTQPTVSRRLQALELSLGLTLLVRSTHALRLTEAGARYYQRACELALVWSEFESELRGAIDEAQGTLRIVVPHAFGQYQLVGPLAKFLTNNPKVSIEWMLHDKLPSFIEAGIDCAIHVGPVTDQSVVAIKIGEVPRIVVAAPALLTRTKRYSSPQTLEELPWIALSPYYRKEVRLHNRQGDEYVFGISPRVITDSLYALRSAALRGVGVAVSSTWVVEDELASGKLIQLVPAWQAAVLPIYLIYPYAPFYPAKLRNFIAMMRHAMTPLPTL